MGQIFPRCKLNLTSSYVSAQGFYFPCCWLGNEPHATALKKFVGEEDFKKLHVAVMHPKDWESNPAMHKLVKSWEDASFRPCEFFCGKPIDDLTASINVDRRDENFYIDLKTKKIQR